MQFSRELRDDVMAGDITLSVRLWKRPLVKEGGRYRVGPGMIEIDAIELVPFAAITEADVQRSGEPDRQTLRNRAAHAGPIDDDTLVYRIELHAVDVRCQDGTVDIGDIGIWTSYRPFGKERAGEAARIAEALGYGAWWVGGSPHVPDVRPILEATSTLVAATGILNVWSNEPRDTAEAAAVLRAEFPGRFMLGMGIGHPEATSDYRRPLTTMREFLDGLDASPTPPPVDDRCLAALGPKMLDLAGERSAGTHSYFTTVEHTRLARDRLGPGKLVAPELACVVDTDPVRARAVARDYAKLYLGLRNYTKNLLDLGFTETDLADGGSDRLIDAVVPHGSAEQIAEAVRAHLQAGADHVCLQPLGEDGIPRTSWTALADALID